MSPRLALQFLGLPQIHLDDRPVAAQRRKVIALLAYLAVNDLEHGTQRYSRESLSALLWPEYEQDRAFANLRHTLWEVHQALGEGWLLAERESICLNAQADIDLDVARFRELLSQSRAQSEPQKRIPLLVQATRLYRNHFLTGFSLKDAYGFNEWAYAQSEDLRRQLAGALETLSNDYCAGGEAEKAIPHARRLITLDPLNEASHRQLMGVYIQAGQHSAALKQYQACEQILRKELGLDPQPETRALYKRIRRREVKAVHPETQPQADRAAHNLPSQLSTFIGREKEMAEVAQLLAQHRLVTLAGAGGIGKTRLSLQVGRKLLDEYPDGVWFIELDALSDPELVPQTIASVFDVREIPGHPVLDVLVNLLHEKTALLILDNCEHVLDACVGLAVRLLTNCPRLRILATSREVLNVTGGATYQLPSLLMPAGDEGPLERLSGYESVRLFVERAALALASFTLTKENAAAVIEICRKVDGIPLAIELAAAQVHVLQVSEILEQLRSSFGLLSTDGRTALSRHETLQASLDWSWGLLAEAEQTFLYRLAVFAGGWTLDAANTVCDGDALVLTSTLVRKSLIVVDQAPGRATRYRFHEIVRQYALRKLVEAGEQEQVRAKHLHYFLQLSEQIEAELQAPQETEWLTQADEERDNLRAALEQAARTDTQAGLYISGRLQGFWEMLNAPEGERWLAEFLHRPDADEYPHAKAKALYALGMLLIWAQDYARADTVTQECLALFQSCGDREGEIDVLLLRGHALTFLDRRAEADRLYAQARDLARSAGDARRQARALFRLGYDRPAFQLEYWETAIDLFRQAGDLNSAASLLYASARFRLLLTGDLETAEKHVDEATQFGPLRPRNIGGLWEEEAFAKSLIARMRGDYEQAAAILEKTVRLAEELGNRMGYFWTRVQLGHVVLRAGDLPRARAIFAETARNFQQDGSTIGVIFALEGLAALSLAVGKPEHAARIIGWADAARLRIRDPRPFLEQAHVDQVIAACLARMGEAAFSDVYDAGKEMTLDEAVSYSLAGGFLPG